MYLVHMYICKESTCVLLISASMLATKYFVEEM